MRTHPAKAFVAAFTLTDLLIVAAAVILVPVALLPMMGRTRNCHTPRIVCVSNLKQVGLAFRIWSSDHEEKFPWQVSTNQGGSKEFIGTTEAFQHFLVASNEFNSPKILRCRSDSQRTGAQDFDHGLANSNLSYFLSLDAVEGRPQAILSGDRNITGGALTNGVMLLTAHRRAGWTREMHENAGNISFADGSVQQMSTDDLRSFVKQKAELPARLVIP